MVGNFAFGDDFLAVLALVFDARTTEADFLNQSLGDDGRAVHVEELVFDGRTSAVDD
jgi:hypothetical protein